MTIVNGQVLLEDGKHTGALPGRVIRNSWYHEHRNSRPDCCAAGMEHCFGPVTQRILQAVSDQVDALPGVA